MAGTSHGHTPAAWTGVIIAFIGFCVAGAFMVMAEPLGLLGRHGRSSSSAVSSATAHARGRSGHAEGAAQRACASGTRLRQRPAAAETASSST